MLVEHSIRDYTTPGRLQLQEGMHGACISARGVVLSSFSGFSLYGSADGDVDVPLCLQDSRIPGSGRKRTPQTNQDPKQETTALSAGPRLASTRAG